MKYKFIKTYDVKKDHLKISNSTYEEKICAKINNNK